MFNTKQLFKRAKSAALATSLIAIQILSPVSTFLILNHTAPALAADTAVLTPNGQGNYTAWDNGEATVDETDGPSCSIDDSIIEDTSNNRESVNLDLSSVTDGSTVSSVTVYAWDRGHNDTTGGTYKTFVRVDGTDTDATSNLATTTSAQGSCTQRSQTIDIADFVKSGSTDLEIGVIKTATNTYPVRIGALRAVVTYTAPAPAPQADLTATKTNSVVGSAAFNQPFTWTIRVQNSGTATASFSDNQDILRDERPSTGVASYGAPTAVGVGTTGNFDCTQSGTNNRDLVCEANGATTMPVGSYVDVTFTATPNASGSLTNPRNSGDCSADNGNVVSESNENNNTCSNNVTVNPDTGVANPQPAASLWLRYCIGIGQLHKYRFRRANTNEECHDCLYHSIYRHADSVFCYQVRDHSIDGASIYKQFYGCEYSHNCYSCWWWLYKLARWPNKSTGYF